MTFSAIVFGNGLYCWKIIPTLRQVYQIKIAAINVLPIQQDFSLEANIVMRPNFLVKWTTAKAAPRFSSVGSATAFSTISVMRLRNVCSATKRSTW